MSFFKKKSVLHDVDRYYRKKKYWRLFDLLIEHENSVIENSIIIEKIIKALSDLFSDDDAYQLRKPWMTINIYDAWIGFLESENLIIFKETIEPLVRTIQNEQSALQESKEEQERKEELVIQALDARSGMVKLQKDTLRELCEIIEDGEYVEYGQQFNLGLWVKVNEGILLTNKRIIYFYGSLGATTINAISYHSISTVKKGLNNVKIINNTGPNIKYRNDSGTHKLTSHIEDKIQ